VTVVVEAKQSFEQAKKDAKAAVDRARAEFGHTIKTARLRDQATQDALAKALGLTREQVRRYERYYEDWADKNGEL
jgi:DNA-binding XRE family transcriptional regulator